MRSPMLLLVDAVINFLLGILLILFPASFVAALGIPGSESAFYPNILGAVLFGIGIALLVERFRGSGGLGLIGAVSINLSGGLVLAVWLLSGSLVLPLRGRVILWILVLILVVISSLELFVRAPRRSANEVDH
jgi:hypothetical protein